MYDCIDQVADYDAFVDSLVNLKTAVVNDNYLTCHEKQTIRVGISVAANSARFWMPSNMGGEIWYDTYGQDLNGRGWSWKNALGGDLAATTRWCFQIEIAGSMGVPVGTADGTIAGTVGFAISSAFAGAGVP